MAPFSPRSQTLIAPGIFVVFFQVTEMSPASESHVIHVFPVSCVGQLFEYISCSIRAHAKIKYQ